MKTLSSWILLSFLALSSTFVIVVVEAFDYIPNVENAAQNLVDKTTGIDELRTIFIDDTILVNLEGIEWAPVFEDNTNNNNATTDSSSFLKWETSVNGVVQTTGTIDLADVNRELPTSIEAGYIVVDKSKLRSIVCCMHACMQI